MDCGLTKRRARRQVEKEDVCQADKKEGRKEERKERWHLGRHTNRQTDREGL